MIASAVLLVLNIFFSPPAVQLGRPQKLVLLDGTDGSFFVLSHCFIWQRKGWFQSPGNIFFSDENLW